MHPPRSAAHVAIACGGTGGHLFPGLAVAAELAHRGAHVTLLISPKEIDQQAVRTARDFTVITLPAVGLTRGGLAAFVRGFTASYRAARQSFRTNCPDAVLAMGGFTSAPPILAGRRCGAKTFLHESNTLPGRANRWLAHVVDAAYVYFHEASGRLNCQKVEVTGMPVRSAFLEPVDSAAARVALGLDPAQPVLLVMGGSQGASGVNDLVLRSVPLIIQRQPNLQFLHLTGPDDFEKVRTAYATQKCRAVVRPFLTEMELALGAATAAVSRAGASSIAELAATGLPAVLVPYPHAADDHQLHNARALVETDAARLVEQRSADPEHLAADLGELCLDPCSREVLRSALARWHFPRAASDLAKRILASSGFPELAARPSLQDEPMELPR